MTAEPSTAPQSAPAIRVEGLSKCYQVYERPQDRLKQALFPRLQRLAGRSGATYFRDFWALRDVSFEVQKGQTLGVIGRNGSGKSTLLQIICGTLSPTTGSVSVNGRVAALLELGSGFNPDFTGRENIYMSGAVLGLSTREIDERYDAIVAFADIGDFLSQPVKTYSSGMFVRLAFAVIAHADADILVIDEALSVGDVFFGQKCMRFLRKFQETGTVLFVSHDAAAVVNLCDVALMLDQGVLTMHGSAKEVSEAYHASAAYALPLTSPKRSDVVQVPDQRQELIRASTLRNDIQIFRFDPRNSGFGDGSAKITAAQLTDIDGIPLDRIVGGERVRLVISARAEIPIFSPIVGFFLKDRLGQHLIGDNTYLTYGASPLALDAGEEVRATFEFFMPILPQGRYSFDFAIAAGTHLEHLQADWVHDAIVVESHSSSVSTGLVGVPMHAITLQAVRQDTPGDAPVALGNSFEY